MYDSNFVKQPHQCTQKKKLCIVILCSDINRRLFDPFHSLILSAYIYFFMMKNKLISKGKKTYYFYVQFQILPPSRIFEDS